MKRIFALLLTLTVLPWTVGAEELQQIRFGIIATKQAGQPYMLTQETLVIPLRLKATGFRWGYEILIENSTEYRHRAVFHLPAPPVNITGGLEGSKDSPTIVNTPESKGRGRTIEPFHFDAGDPLGEWKIEIFINDRLTRTFKFQVVKDE
jgi:hypothetical protein